MCCGIKNQLHELPIPLFAEITTGPVNKLYKMGWDSKWVRKATVHFWNDQNRENLHKFYILQNFHLGEIFLIFLLLMNFEKTIDLIFILGVKIFCLLGGCKNSKTTLSI